MNYKIIDGVLYQKVDTEQVRAQLNEIKNKIQPFINGIAEAERLRDAYDQQIIGYKQQITSVISNENLDPEIVKAVDPEAARLLGFLD